VGIPPYFLTFCHFFRREVVFTIRPLSDRVMPSLQIPAPDVLQIWSIISFPATSAIPFLLITEIFPRSDFLTFLGHLLFLPFLSSVSRLDPVQSSGPLVKKLPSESDLQRCPVLLLPDASTGVQRPSFSLFPLPCQELVRNGSISAALFFRFSAFGRPLLVTRGGLFQDYTFSRCFLDADALGASCLFRLELLLFDHGSVCNCFSFFGCVDSPPFPRCFRKK